MANNIFFRNSCVFFGGAVAFLKSNPVFIYNTLTENSSEAYGGAIYCNDSAKPTIVNTIIYGNNASVGHEVYIWDIYSVPAFFHSNIEGGKEAFGGTGAAGYSADYINNIDAEPTFDKTPPYFCRLLAESPCINSGTISFSGETYPQCDFAGNPRINGSYPDIGAFEYIANLGTDKSEYDKVFSAAPNPFKNNINLQILHPLPSEILIRIVNNYGTLIKEIHLPPGTSDFTWDGRDFSGKPIPSGIYFFIMKSKNSIQTLKIIRNF